MINQNNKIFFSGIQPSNDLHIGNYIGSILQWKRNINQLSDNSKMYCMIADLHAMTNVKSAKELENSILSLFATYIACGIEHNQKVKLFVQSKVPEHTELCWILSTVTPLGQLQRMTQFKDKTSKNGTDSSNAGLLFYPILQAADILLYNTDFVPVGEDQKQHLELTRDLAGIFNNTYKTKVLKVPEVLIQEKGKRIMSLKDGTKKMSKSDENQDSMIKLTDLDDDITRKIKTAKTDSISGIFYDKINRPEVSNLLDIFAILSNQNVESVESVYKVQNTKVFKDDLTNLLIEFISPIRNNIKNISASQSELKKTLLDCSEDVKKDAALRIEEIKKICLM